MTSLDGKLTLIRQNRLKCGGMNLLCVGKYVVVVSVVVVVAVVVVV